ncbi:unnamed protein product [Clonostachys rosea]|uniref:CN hydrolase domain-containing protein n=1 Tax=Bionectria ochroleuca TaxID=29856 RepID=A0ABY6TWV4_BIOOC|nr:unnamed protein product [Clonostachys rosea]
MSQIIKVAACHASPIFLSAKKTTEKSISLIQEASRRGANLVIFPETFIPAFPVWSSIRPPTDNHDLFKRMVKESIDVSGPEVNALRATAKQNGTMISIGISEKVQSSCGTLYNSNLIIGDDGEILVHHRKLMPTFFEKLTWSPGDGYGLRVADTKFGKIGNLICGENSNPLARYSLMAQGEQVHISSWPAIWPTRLPSATSEPANSAGAKAANYDNINANRIRAAAHCFEAKCFGIMSAGILDSEAIEIIASGSHNPEMLANFLNNSPRGATMFLDPTGAPLKGFTYRSDGTEEQIDCLQHEEGILYGTMNLEDCIEGKQYHDTSGGYQRLDVLQLKVDRTRRVPAKFNDESGVKVTEDEKDQPASSDL